MIRNELIVSKLAAVHISDNNKDNIFWVRRKKHKEKESMKKLKNLFTVMLIVIMSMVAFFAFGCTPTETGDGGGETKSEYTVTFDSDGGSSVPSVTVKAGESLSEPSAPTKQGSTFGGWMNENGNPFKFGEDKIEKDTTLKAKWDVQSFRVQYERRQHGNGAASSI